jgi:hypothetical protein
VDACVDMRSFVLKDIVKVPASRPDASLHARHATRAVGRKIVRMALSRGV